MSSDGAVVARTGALVVAPPPSRPLRRGHPVLWVSLLSWLASFTVWCAPAGAGTPPRTERPPAAGTSRAQDPAKPTAPPATMALPESASYILVDVGTGNVLAARHEHLRLPPASLTKILTALVAVSYLPSGARVPGTTESADAYPNDVGIEKGVRWPLHDVLEALLVLSANDAAYAVAQRISGSLAAFAKVMERSAKQLGMTDEPVFRDPAGLDGTEGFEGGNLVSARDLAIAGRDFLRVPELARIVVQDSYHFVDPTGAPHYLPSMNYSFLQSYTGAIGIKTGFTDKAGSCIIAAARRNGRTMLAVVLKGYNPTQSATDLLNQGFQTPVSAEVTTDRLPTPALPRPLARPGPSLHRQGRAGAGSVPGAPQAGAGGQRRPVRLEGAARMAAVGTSPERARHGLSSVLAAWPAQALLFLAGAAALVALWELRSLQQVNGRSRRSYRPRRPGNTPMNGVAGGRRRRAQLVASYRRHERP